MSGLASIVVFARAPAPGRVKTRLAGAVGDEGAARLAAAFLRDTWSSLGPLPWARRIVATTGPLVGELRDIDACDQGGGGLGARIERTLRRALVEAPIVLAIGADTPGLPRPLLDQARLALDSADAVLGPCDDGGFYLLGLRRCPRGLLAGLPWSRPDTFVRVRARLEERGFSVGVIDPWFDVDRPEDLERLERLIHEGAVTAPATARVLAEQKPARGATAEPRISVIIPTLDEERRIAARLGELGTMPGIHEVLVVDGGSRDGTVELARSFPGVRVFDAPRGRARQMNHGAAAAAGDVLLFLHADVALPGDAAARVREVLADPHVVAGAFRTWTTPDGKRSRLASLLHLADLRSRYTSLPYGDQALFVRAAAFWAAGGYPDLPLMEDLELSGRLRRLGRIRTVRASVRVSGRRFLSRPLYYAVLMNLFPILFRLGIPPPWLARAYGDPR